MAEKCREKYGGESHLVRVPVPGVDTAVLVIKLHSAGDSLAEGEACNTQIQLSSSVAHVTTFLTRSLGLGSAQLGPEWLRHMLGHQGVLGLDLGEGVGHDHQVEVR